jgi:hypothetical protein
MDDGPEALAHTAPAVPVTAASHTGQTEAKRRRIALACVACRKRKSRVSLRRVAIMVPYTCPDP